MEKEEQLQQQVQNFIQKLLVESDYPKEYDFNYEFHLSNEPKSALTKGMTHDMRKNSLFWGGASPLLKLGN